MTTELLNKHFYLGKDIKKYIETFYNKDEYARILFSKYKYDLKDDIYYYFYKYSYNSYDFGYEDGIICYTTKETVNTCKVIKESKSGIKRKKEK